MSRAPLRLFIAALAVVLVAMGCSGDKKSATPTGGAATPSTASPAASAASWDSRAVWEWSKADNAWREACNSSPVAVQQTSSCVLDAMSKGGASAQAVAFFKHYGYFLSAFNDLGRVDYGRGSAPWINMGRPTQQLFLNGQPSLIETGRIDDTWKQRPGYADLLAKEPQASPWPEYGTLTQATTTAAGGQHIEIAYPLLVCRACQRLGLLTVAYEFDANGKQTGETVLALKPAPA